MTVRVNKDSFNLREKLSELERPIGLNGSALMRTETPQEAFSLIGARNRNLIINGDMRIAQRATSVSGSNGGGYTVCDRWNLFDNSGSVNIAQSSTVPATTGFGNSLQFTVNSTGTLSSTSVFTPNQQIEGFNSVQLLWGTSNAKSITVSFWCRSSVTGTYGIFVRNSSANRFYATSFDVSVANTWRYVTATIPGDTAGTWIGATNGIGLTVGITLRAGSSRTGTTGVWSGSTVYAPTTQVDWHGVAGATFYFTGFQVEEGKVATDFEHRSYGEELALCQRYYYKFRCANQEWIYNEGNAATNKWHQIYIGHPMRANPSVDVTDLTTGGSVSGMSGVTISSISPQTPGDTPGRISSRVTMSGTGGSAYNLHHTDSWNSDYIALSSEL
jgi:hypothetical protein